MQIYWHEFRLVCPQCQRDSTIQNVFTSADGEVLVVGTCEPCRSPLRWRLSMAAIIAEDCRRDLIADAANRRLLGAPQAQAPPIAAGEFTLEDMKHLGDLGILDPDRSGPRPQSGPADSPPC